MIGVAVLGSTGSVGESTLDVLARHRERFSLIAVAAHRNAGKLARQVLEWQPAYAALADETATCAAMWEINPSGELRPELFPLTLQLSVNIIRNVGHGTLTAEAKIVHRGRTTLVVEVEVFDDQRRLIAKLTATQLAPAAPPAEARPHT